MCRGVTPGACDANDLLRHPVTARRGRLAGAKPDVARSSPIGRVWPFCDIAGPFGHVCSGGQKQSCPGHRRRAEFDPEPTRATDLN
jgi:hypothetical protein